MKTNNKNLAATVQGVFRQASTLVLVPVLTCTVAAIMIMGADHVKMVISIQGFTLAETTLANNGA